MGPHDRVNQATSALERALATGATRDPFAGMTAAPATSLRPPQNTLDGFTSQGMGTGSVDHSGRGVVLSGPLQTYSMLNPEQRSAFFTRNRRSDLGHLSAGRPHSPQRGNPTATSGRTILQHPALIGTLPNRPNQAPQVRSVPANPPSPAPGFHGPYRRSSQGVQANPADTRRIAVQAQLAATQNDIANANNRNLNAQTREAALHRAEATLQQLSRPETRTLVQANELRDLRAAAREANFNLQLDTI